MFPDGPVPDVALGLEAATLWGPFSAQGEYGHLSADLPSGAFIASNTPSGGQVSTAPNPFIGIPNPDYTGWYAQAAWFFGGRQTYDNEGKWGRPIIPDPLTWGKGGGWGGLEIVGKYDVINLSDSAFNNALNKNSAFVGGCPTNPALSRNRRYSPCSRGAKYCPVRRHANLDRRAQLVAQRPCPLCVRLLAVQPWRLSDYNPNEANNNSRGL